MTTYEYGAVSSRFSCEADDKLTAYAAMVYHYRMSAHMIAIYEPEECKKDQWLNITGEISERLHEIFGGKPEEFPENDAFDKYVDDNVKDIQKCMDSIKQLC